MNVSAAYFETMYQDSDDPWSLATRWYDHRKYGLTVAALPRERYRNAFEPGCSVGELSFLLADRCDRLLSCDREPRAVAAATARVAGRDTARVEHRVIPGEWPEGEFDLVVFSEILYYFDAATVDRLLAHVQESLMPGGTLAAVHWRYPVSDHAQSAQDVHDAVRSLPWLTSVARHEEPDFLLDVFVRTDGENRENHENSSLASVAAAEGLV
jgi:SAM-dependent methyltransferase